MRFEYNSLVITLDKMPMIGGQYRVIENHFCVREWVFDSWEDASKMFVRRVSYALNVYLEEFSHE
jgi:hypothetical protein